MEQRENVTEYFPLGTHSEHWGPEKTCHVLVHLHCDNVGQHTHFPDCGVQPNTGCPYVLFFLATSHLWMLFILPQSPKHDYSLTVWKENHSHPSLHDSAFYRALMWWCYFTPGGHGLWPLRGHLQTLALFDNHESAAVYSAVAVGLDWWIFTWCISSSPVYNLPFCVPMSLTTPAVTYSLSSNLPSLAPVFLPSRCWPMMGPLVWSSLHSYLSPTWAFCAPWRILFGMGGRKLVHQWLPHHCAGSLCPGSYPCETSLHLKVKLLSRAPCLQPHGL